MKIATLIQTLEGLSEQGYTEMLGASLTEHGLVIELKELDSNDEKQVLPASTFTPPGTQICHPAPGKALAVLPKDMIDEAERETDNENQATSSDPGEDVISASPDCSCEISVPLPTGYRVTLRGFGKVAAASSKDANGQGEHE